VTQCGGSLDNHIRFAVEVATAVADEIGAGRTGIRISPGNPFQLGDLTEDDPHELYPHLVRALAPLDLAYLHLAHGGDEEPLGTLRQLWRHTLILNRAGTDIATRAKDIENGIADMITVGSVALANPDLVDRVRAGAPLNTPDTATFYGGGAAGSTDYPTYAA
jgi:N-ethylmaleimide reductase